MAARDGPRWRDVTPERGQPRGAARMRRVSVNEVLRLSKRVYLARGAGPGCEHDPAESVVWLETRGLPGLVTLRADGSCGGPSVPRWRHEESCGPGGARLALHGDGSSAAWLAANVVDWLLAAGPGATVHLEGVRSPLWLVPDLVARLPGGRLTALDATGVTVLLRADVTAATLALWCAPAALAGRLARVILEAAPGAAGAQGPAQAPRILLHERELATRHAASLAAGIAVPESLWRALYEESRGALVPESDASRVRGAGAQGE